MGVRLNQLIDRCLEISGGRGLSESKPIVVKIKEPTLFRETLIAVAYDEPHELILPLNVTWIDANPNSVDYFKAFKRVSKTPSGGFNNSWDEVNTYEEVFEPPQYWAPEDTPVPVYSEESPGTGGGASQEQLDEKVDRAGDTLTGPLRTRELPVGQTWDPKEVFPREFFTSELNRNTQGFYSILSQFNRRLIDVEQLALDNKRRLDELGDLGGGTGSDGITEQRIAELEALAEQNRLLARNNEQLGNNNKQRLDNLGNVDTGDSGTDAQQIADLRLRIEQNENAIDNIDTSGGTGSGVSRYIHTQIEMSNNWTVQHDLSSVHLVYVVRDQNGRTIIPETQTLSPGSNDISVITFAEPITGTALVFSV